MSAGLGDILGGATPPSPEGTRALIVFAPTFPRQAPEP